MVMNPMGSNPYKNHQQKQPTSLLVGGWTNPCEEYISQNGFIFPKDRGKNSKNIWDYHLVFRSTPDPVSFATRCFPGKPRLLRLRSWPTSGDATGGVSSVSFVVQHANAKAKAVIQRGLRTLRHGVQKRQREFWREGNWVCWVKLRNSKKNIHQKKNMSLSFGFSMDFFPGKSPGLAISWPSRPWWWSFKPFNNLKRQFLVQTMLRCA